MGHTVDDYTKDFGYLSKCSNITEGIIRNMNWIRVSIAISGLLLMMMLLIVVMVRKEFKTVIERLFIYLVIATFLREAVLVSNIEHQFAYQYMDVVCSVIGALNFYTAILVVLYGAATVLYILSRVIWYRGLQRSKAFATFFETGFVFLAFLLPLILSISLLYADIFGL